MEGARRTLGELVARMRAQGLRRLEVTDTDPPVVILDARLAAELERILDEQQEALGDYSQALDNLTGQLDLDQALPVEEAIAELRAERAARSGEGHATSVDELAARRAERDARGSDGDATTPSG
jgi:hypothetical protein